MAPSEGQPGNGGWVRINDPRLPGWLYVRFEPDDRGRLRPRDLFLEGADEPITARHLRSVPLEDAEAWANGMRGQDSVAGRLPIVAPDLRGYAATFATTYGKPVSAPTKKAPPRPPIPDAPTVERAPLRRPEGRALPDAFLEEVAGAYSALAQNGQKPAPVIAAEAEVPVTTVHRWIKEARRRGLLAPARRGATG
ncbi:hypothetical protein [Frankia sp. EAN1pec]|uniref:hypothetical protein n=1 Tax=Parafrankia sp. (strain EAN1pec) TaxID=298653 RepID=UPI0012FC10D0